MISREDTEKIYVFLGIGGFGDKTTEQLLIEWNFRKYKILLQAMFKLIDLGWEFEFDKDRVYLLKDIISCDMYFPYINNDKTQALTQAIIYAIDNEGR